MTGVTSMPIRHVETSEFSRAMGAQETTKLFSQSEFCRPIYASLSAMTLGITICATALDL